MVGFAPPGSSMPDELRDCRNSASDAPSALRATDPKMFGEVLLDLVRLRQGAGTLPPGALDEVASRHGATIRQVESASRFVAGLMRGRAEGKEPLVCRGLTCRLHGADALWVRLGEALTGDVAAWQPREAHCLGQCDAGPSIRVGRSILVVRGGEVREDRRGWHEEDGGAVPFCGS